MEKNGYIKMEGLTKRFSMDGKPFEALKPVSLELPQGGMVALSGPSGSGKSTLLNMMAGIDRPSGGSVSVGGVKLEELTEDQLARWRGNNVGVVFQFFQLIPTLTVLENVMLPMDFCNRYPRRERPERALALLEQVGVAAQARKFPATLSGGQQQRVAISRALANDPPLLLADEPTGNLDSATAEAIFDLFQKLNGTGKTVVVATHERAFSKYFGRAITILDGQVAGHTASRERSHA